MRVLAGDVGGTKTLLALVEVEESGFRFLREARAESRSAGSLGDLARRFLVGTGGADRACFGIAAPVTGEVCEGPNLPWPVRAEDVARAIGIPETEILNDFEAVGYGIGRLEPGDLFTLQEGSPSPGGPVALLGAGTGLGEAFILRTEGGARVFPTEGGHADFAPRTEIEFGLLRFLRGRIGGRVSVERVLSGPGLASIYEYVVVEGLAPADASVRAEMDADDPAAVVSRRAQEGGCPACCLALDLFVSLYGAEAGNLALRTLATGGVYLAGGIAPRILGRLRGGAFLDAFLDKGRLAPLLARFPVRVILTERAPILGAASFAARAR